MNVHHKLIVLIEGNLHRIQDMYTRDRSTPRTDKFYGGEDSLTSAVGSQVDGVTTIVFRKPVQGIYKFSPIFAKVYFECQNVDIRYVFLSMS